MYEELFEQNRALVNRMARQYARVCALDRAVSVEDLTQAGFMGLMKAANTFNPDAGKGWAGWARWHIQMEFRSALGLRKGRFTRAHTGAATLDKPARSDDAEGATLGDFLLDESLPEADEALLKDELRRDVRAAVGRLKSERQRQVVKLCKLEGRSYQQAAESLGVSVGQAYQLYFRASAHLARDPQLRMLAGLDDRARLQKPRRSARKKT